jgi:hypothetical protein
LTQVYHHPDEYDLEHLGDQEDIGFYLGLVRRLRPKCILELACGTGRITLPIATSLIVTDGVLQLRRSGPVDNFGYGSTIMVIESSGWKSPLTAQQAQS